MKTRLIRMMTVIALLLLAAACRAECRGTVERVNGLWVVHVEGSPYDMGLQQGTLMKDSIQNIYKIYLNEHVLQGWIKQYGMLKDPKIMRNPRAALLAKAKLMEKHIPKEYLEEMKGIADGAGVQYDDVLLLTAHVDYFAILCSGFAAFGKETKDGHLVHGRNLDWAKGGLRELDEETAVIVFKPEKGRPFVSIGYPGILGVLTGMNDRRISTELNFSMAKGDENKYDGAPVMVLMRQITQYGETLADVGKILSESQRTAGFNILAADGKNDTAELFEITGKTFVAIMPSDNFLLTTNHFTSKELADKSMNTSFSASSSQERYNRLRKLVVDNKGAVDPKLAMSMMHDSGVKVDGTVQTVVFAPSTMRFWVWSRNRKPGDFAEFDMMELLGTKMAPM